VQPSPSRKPEWAAGICAERDRESDIGGPRAAGIGQAARAGAGNHRPPRARARGEGGQVTPGRHCTHPGDVGLARLSPESQIPLNEMVREIVLDSAGRERGMPGVIEANSVEACGKRATFTPWLRLIVPLWASAGRKHEESAGQGGERR
jgi:hypothetical protein